MSHGIVYKWFRRFREEGEVGLRDRGSRPHEACRNGSATRSYRF